MKNKSNSKRINLNSFQGILTQSEPLEENLRLRKISEEFSLLVKENSFLKNNLQEINKSIAEKIKEKNELLEASKESLEKAILDLEEVINKNILLENTLYAEIQKNKVLKRKIDNIQRKYNSLSNSTLGSLTIKYWNYKRKES